MPLQLFPSGATDTPAKQWTLLTWFASFAPALGSMIFIVVSTVKADPCFSPLFGMGVAGLMAALWHVVGITASVFMLIEGKFNPFSLARNLFVPVPAYWKPALLTQSQPAGAIALACVLLGDGAFDIANGLCAFLAFETPAISPTEGGFGSLPAVAGD